MKEKEYAQSYGLRIEKARKDPEIMSICDAEYLGDNGKPPLEDWEPSDEEVWAVIERIGLD